MQQIKITSFKRLDDHLVVNKQKILVKQNTYQSFNVIFYTEQNQSNTKQLQNWIRTQLKTSVKFSKITDQKSIIHAIKNLLDKQPTKTFFISTKLFNKQTLNLTKINSHDNFEQFKQKLTFILLVESCEQVPPQIFHNQNVSLITTQPEKIKSILTKQMENISKNSNQLNQLSSLNSENQQNFENQFQKACGVINLPKQQSKKFLKTQEIVMNDNPGVGSYNISSISQSFQGSHSGTFSKQKR